MRRALIVLAALALSGSAFGGTRSLSLEERVRAQRAIEEVYWRHRIWPAGSPGSKPRLEDVMPDTVLRSKVDDYLRKSDALEKVWGRGLTARDLQAEMDRMAARTRSGAVLAELFEALGDDPSLIAETLVRQTLANRLLRDRYAGDAFDAWWASNRERYSAGIDVPVGEFHTAVPRTTGCVEDSWSPMPSSVPDPRNRHSAVWTGAEMIVWGGESNAYVTGTGGRYDPATDTWVDLPSGTGAPPARKEHEAVWTGTEMILWGGRPENGL